MAIATVPSLWVPPPNQSNLSVPNTGASNFVLNASGDKVAVVFRAPKTGNIHRLGFFVGTATTPTNTDVRLETVSAQVPTGTLYGTNTNGTIASGSITATTFVYATLTADAAVTVNDLVAMVIAPSGSPNYQVRVIGSVLAYQMPYFVDGSAGSYSLGGATPSSFAVEYDDGSYAVIPGMTPYSAVTAVTYNSSSNPEIVGLKFKLPAPFRVSGGWIGIDLDNSVDIELRDSDGTTVLATSSLTNAGRIVTTGASPFYFKFNTAPSLLANTFYYLAVKPGASNITVYHFDVPSAAALDQIEGGQNFHYATFHTSTWTATTTRRPFMGLEINGIDNGVSVQTRAATIINGGVVTA